jgi:hypothetical protein
MRTRIRRITVANISPKVGAWVQQVQKVPWKGGGQVGSPFHP